MNEELTEEEAHLIAKQRILNKEYLPQQAPDADRVKELYYTSNLEGYVDREVRDQNGQILGIERTAGDLPQKLKDDYYFLINKVYALGKTTEKDRRIDELETMLATLIYNAQKPKKQRKISDALDQQAALMIHNGLYNMSGDGFNRQMSSTITQLQGQFYKVGKSMKDIVGNTMDSLRSNRGE